MSELVVGSLKGLAANDFKIEVAPGSQIVQPGAILQVVQGVLDAPFTTSAGSYQATGLSVSITPSSTTSKVLVQVFTNFSKNGASENAYLSLFRDSTNLVSPASPGSRTAVINAKYQAVPIFDITAVSFSFLDSPATTSAISYNLRAYTQGGTSEAIFINRSSNDGNDAFNPRAVSTIVAMEVAG
jgi:hypothetical protein